MPPAPRRRSAGKRTAILDAARELFVRDGVDHVSMDAVAIGAQVSKATLYSHFGSKQLLFLAILADVSESLTAAVEKTLDQHLDPARIRTLPQLEEALTRFAGDLATMMTGSEGYGGVLTLVNQRRWQTPEPADDVATEPVVQILAARLAGFADAGLLDLDDSRTAAFHFGALTLLLANDDQPDPRNVDPDRLRRVVAGGVRTFVRAFGARQSNPKP
ncbi:efflux system transcriptional repressor MexL [Winogradskya consettensis]|uniref:Transcriptional regulator n=1 Tax=Winogradskya consettensis TaxID=113560 RepID=A0A919SYA9_9ACTN|nr:TetR/AcrR family transcriptional regulator [Actinoplanes consettensis]GIM81000.1 transcriptional regulator [Actinoplanes consettensis]